MFPPCTGRLIARLSVPTPAPLPGFFCQKTARGTLPGAQACGLHGRACPPREAAPRPNQYPRLTAGGHWPPRARHGAPWIPTAQPGCCCIPTRGVVPLNIQTHTADAGRLGASPCRGTVPHPTIKPAFVDLHQANHHQALRAGRPSTSLRVVREPPGPLYARGRSCRYPMEKVLQRSL